MTDITQWEFDGLLHGESEGPLPVSLMTRTSRTHSERCDSHFPTLEKVFKTITLAYSVEPPHQDDTTEQDESHTLPQALTATADTEGQATPQPPHARPVGSDRG